MDEEILAINETLSNMHYAGISRMACGVRKCHFGRVRGNYVALVCTQLDWSRKAKMTIPRFYQIQDKERHCKKFQPQSLCDCVSSGQTFPALNVMFEAYQSNTL